MSLPGGLLLLAVRVRACAVEHLEQRLGARAHALVQVGLAALDVVMKIISIGRVGEGVGKTGTSMSRPQVVRDILPPPPSPT